jgi:hypothetical protein
MTRAERHSHLTAIYRDRPSAPTGWLMDNGLVQLPPVTDDLSLYRILDYGCGRGGDARWYGFDSYDPHFCPELLTGKFRYIICNYVLNVLPKSREADILRHIKSLLTWNGQAFITVRRNIRKPGYTSKGTYQRNVRLPLQIARETSDYCIYSMTREDKIGP